MFEMAVTIVVIAFFCEMVDSTLGGGFGTILTPLLLLMGYSLIEIVPAILISETLSGILSGIMHHRETNVDFRERTQLFVTILLISCSIVGVIGAKYVILSIPKKMIKLYIGVLITVMGILILMQKNKNFKFSPIKIFVLGIIASFNKALSGGGYGPLVMAGQMVSGVKSKNAIGITSMAEGITCLTALSMYFITFKEIDLRLFPLITIGALVSVPFAAKWVKRIDDGMFKVLIGLLIVVLGVLILIKCR